MSFAREIVAEFHRDNSVRVTADESTEMDRLFAEFESTEKQIETKKKAEAINAKMSASRDRQTTSGAPASERPAERNIPANADAFIDRETGQHVAVLSHGQRFADASPNRTGVSVGDWLRGVMVGGKDSRDIRNELATDPGADGGYPPKKYRRSV